MATRLHTLLGSMLDADNDVEGARAAFREALRLHPGDGRTFHAWARLEARLLKKDADATLETMYAAVSAVSWYGLCRVAACLLMQALARFTT